jgi:hypothetical protein
MSRYERDFESALALVVADIEAHPGRERQNVVLIPGGSRDITTPDEASKHRALLRIFKVGINRILALGVPFVCAAGNFAEPVSKNNRHCTCGLSES